MLKKEYYELVKEYRRNLHQIPEIGFDLTLTSKYLQNELLKLGYEIKIIAKTGVMAIKLGKVKEAIAFRADMDALMVNEKTDLSFKSKHQGAMHACGHDGHMAILLGFAKFLSTIATPNKTIILLFQPAEEGPGGAKVIIEEGIFKTYNIQTIFGIHLYPGLEEGKIGLVDGAMMAQSGEFDITIEGVSSHGAEPHTGIDAILAASKLITNYQTIVSRNLDPFSPAVITVGTINGGEARNVISKQVNISGTIRSFDSKQYQYIKTRMDEMNNGIEMMYRVKVRSEIRDFYPPVINNHDLFDLVKKSLLEEQYQIIKPMMFSEDFAFYQQEIPGLFVMLGTKNENKGYIHPLHSCYFNFDETVLIQGIEYYIMICKIMNVI